MNYSIIISPLFRLLYLFSQFFRRKKTTNFYALTFGWALTLGRRLLWGGGGAYYRSLISSLQQMPLLLGSAYYRGALIIGSLRYPIFNSISLERVVCIGVLVFVSLSRSLAGYTKFWPFLHVSNHEYYGDNFISNPNPRYKVSIISHQY